MKDKSKAIISLTGVSKVYGSGHASVKALTDVSLTINRGDLLLIKGPSGSGKTTLLTIIGLLLTPSSGKLVYGDDRNIDVYSSEAAAYRLDSIGFIFQSFNLMDSLTSWENVALPYTISKKSKAEGKAKAHELLRNLGIEKRAEHFPSQLSGGEKQRVAVARALINDPAVILADEPTANLDSKTGLAIVDKLCEIACRDNRAVVIVSHDERIEKAAKRIITIEDGKLIDETVGGHINYCPHKHT